MTLLEVIARAREAVKLLTALPIDQVVQSDKVADGWRVQVDVIEVRARMGDNDLLATYEVTLDGTGELVGFKRTNRYNREAGAQSGAAGAAA